MSWYTGLSTTSIIVNTLVTEGWSAAWTALNIAMKANPIFWIVTVIAILVAITWSAIKAYDKWGATVLFLMGPFGMLVNAIMALKNNWNSIKSAFTEGGIISGLKRIGIVLLDTLLYPMQQLLNIISKIPGLGKLAGSGEQMIAGLRKSLNLADPVNSDIKKSKKVPGTNQEYGSTGVADKVANKQTAQSVASGGTRNTSINISIGKMVESLIYHGGVGENAQDVERKIEEVLMRALFAAESAS